MAVMLKEDARDYVAAAVGAAVTEAMAKVLAGLRGVLDQFSARVEGLEGELRGLREDVRALSIEDINATLNARFARVDESVKDVGRGVQAMRDRAELEAATSELAKFTAQSKRCDDCQPEAPPVNQPPPSAPAAAPVLPDAPVYKLPPEPHYAPPAPQPVPQQAPPQQSVPLPEQPRAAAPPPQPPHSYHPAYAPPFSAPAAAPPQPFSGPPPSLPPPTGYSQFAPPPPSLQSQSSHGSQQQLPYPSYSPAAPPAPAYGFPPQAPPMPLQRLNFAPAAPPPQPRCVSAAGLSEGAFGPVTRHGLRAGTTQDRRPPRHARCSRARRR